MSYTKNLYENNMETIDTVLENSFWFYLLDTDDNKEFLYTYNLMPNTLKEKVQDILFDLMEDKYGTCDYNKHDVRDILDDIIDDIEYLYPTCTVYDLFDYFNI